MTRFNFKKNKNKYGWIIAILVIIVILIIGYAFFSAEERKIQRQKNLIADKEKLEREQKSIQDQIQKINERLSVLTKMRKRKLLISRIGLVILMICTNLVYYRYFISSPGKIDYSVGCFTDCTSFLILLYTGIAYVSSGTIKAFSRKVHNALFKTVFEEEQNLRDKRNQLLFELAEINEKLTEVNNFLSSQPN